MYLKQLAHLPQNDDEWRAGCQAVAKRQTRHKLAIQAQNRKRAKKSKLVKPKRRKLSRAQRARQQKRKK